MSQSSPTPARHLLTWIHFGDLHVTKDDAGESLARFERAVSLASQHLVGQVDFAFLPGDNANNGLSEQYAGIARAMSKLPIPWHVIPGDHDFEPGSLKIFSDSLSGTTLPYAALIKGYRCIFLDIVSAGKGGPDFRLGESQRRWLEQTLEEAAHTGEQPVVFMHAYPGDMADDPDGLAQLFADHSVAFVDTGHTHYNELLNDGRVIYASTRSTGQIEEGGPGFSLITLDGAVASWRFQLLDGSWPVVQIATPADRRLVTDPADPTHVPVDRFRVEAKVFGSYSGDVLVYVDDGPPTPMRPVSDIPALWAADVEALTDGLHRLQVKAGKGHDAIEVLMRGPNATPKRSAPVALGRDIHSIGAWPEHQIHGSQLGPNKNGQGW